VPPLPIEKVEALVERGAPWSQMTELIDGHAPNGFLIYFRNDAHPVMATAGDPAGVDPSLPIVGLATSGDRGQRIHVHRSKSAAVVEGHLVAVGVREREGAAERPVDGR
jgi:hypothetical protein